MMYSRWRPDTGGYDYFEGSERVGLGDDLPVPKLPVGTNIGVASTDIGRSASSGLRPAGSGQTPRGSIMPLSRQGLSGGLFEAMDLLPWWVTAGVVVAGVGLVAWELRKERAR